MPQNQFSVDVVNPLQALLQGETSFKEAKQDRQKSAIGQLLAQNANGGNNWQQAAMSAAAMGDLESATKIGALSKAFSPPESSADLQAYNLYQKQATAAGQQPLPFLDFKTKLAAAGATRVNNSTNVNTGEKEYDKALNKDLADLFLGYQKSGRNAASAKNTLDLMENLTNDPNFYSGSGGELVTRGKQALVSMGLADPKAASANELFGSLGNKLVIDAAGGSLGAQISNGDVKFIQGTVPGLEKTPDGNRQMIGMQRKLYERQQQTAKMARDYAMKNGGRLDYKFDEMLSDYAEKNPLFKGAAPRQPVVPQGGITQEQYNALPPGTPYTAPDGSPRIKK